MLEVKHLYKTYHKKTAVKDLSFKVNPGEILGLIGRNGAGKSTTFKMILNLLEQDSGEINWNGKKIENDTLKNIGFLPEERGLDSQMTVENQILFFGELHGMKRSEILPNISDWLEKFQVKGTKKSKIKELSKGNQQKIQLISVLIHRPDLIILDEPFSGLDPVNSELLLKNILNEKKQGSTVIFSSHNMGNIERITDKILMLDDGLTALNGTVEEIQETYGRIKLEIEGNINIDDLLNISGIISVKRTKHGYMLTLKNEEVGEKIYSKCLLIEKKYIPVFNQHYPSLDEIFRSVIGGKNEK